MVKDVEERMLELQAGGYSKDNIFITLLHKTRALFGAVVSQSRLVPFLDWEWGYAHTRPMGGNVYYDFYSTFGDGRFLSGDYAKAVEYLNCEGVGAKIAVLAIPSRARLKTVKVSIQRPEKGLRFKLSTRYGTKLPQDKIIVTTTRRVKPNAAKPCEHYVLTDDVAIVNRNTTSTTITTEANSKLDNTAVTVDTTTGAGGVTNDSVTTNVKATPVNTYTEIKEVTPEQFNSWGEFADDDTVSIEIEGISAMGEYVNASSDVILIEAVSVPVSESSDKSNIVVGSFDYRITHSFEVTEAPLLTRC